jgi:hypothetical protein
VLVLSFCVQGLVLVFLWLVPVLLVPLQVSGMPLVAKKLVAMVMEKVK